ncbi:MAG: hypothetical protein AAFY02_11370 [Pseudomonadota bacterium]
MFVKSCAILGLSAGLFLVGFASPQTAFADDCDPAVLHFFKADGLSTTRVGSHKMADMCFDAADRNNDGMLDRDEWSGHFNNLFDSLDSDGDDSVSGDEVQRMQERE